MRRWKVGELARRTGITVRTLHHYDEIGLLSPAARSEAGYRLYTPDDVARLQQILSLRQLGFSLEEIRACLGRAGFSPLQVVEMHLHRVREQMKVQRRLESRLEALAAHLRSAEAVSAEEFIRTMEAMAEVQAEMEAGTDPSDERVRRLATRWHALVREFTGDDAGIERSLRRMYEQEPNVAGLDTGPMQAMAAYLGRAAAPSSD